MKKNIIKFLSLCCCLLISMASCHEQSNIPNDLLLSDGWKVQSSANITLGGEELSQPNYDVQGWYNANVPSTIMGVLTENGLYKDALVGNNYKDIDKAQFDTAWWYRKEFSMPVLNEGQHASLDIDGLSYRANVWLNGKKIADKDSIYGPFRQFKLDVTNSVKDKNVLAIQIYRGREGEPNIGFVDWNPRPTDESMGIYREIKLHVNNDVAMRNTAVHSKVNKESLDEAWLYVETELTNMSNKDVNGDLVGEIEGNKFSVPVKLKANEKRVIKVSSEETEVLHLKNPRLWWCHNLGNPELYDMNLKFVINNKVSDKQKVTFGVREIESYLTKDGGYRGFKLNGKKVLVRSAGWTDDIFLKNTDNSNEIEIQYVRDMNLNSIRLEEFWGTSQNLYNLCDKYGIMAMVGWSCHWEWEGYLGTPCDEYGGIINEHDVNLIANSFNDQVLWLRNHPSIICWFVGSDMMPRPELEKRYKEILERTDDCIYINSAKEMTSSISGKSGMKMAGPYEYVAPNYWYSKEAMGGAFGFNTETGIGAQLPVIESLKKIIPKDQLWPMGDAWNYHCTASKEAMNSLTELTKAINTHYGKATDINDYLRKADLLNYDGTRAMYEAFRVNVPKATGIVQWMLNSAWPSLYWQLYDYYKIPTAAYYSVKKANQTQQLIYDYVNKKVYAVNEGLNNERIKAKMMIYDLKGKQVSINGKIVDLPAYQPIALFDVPVPDDNQFLILQILDNEGNVKSDNVYTLSANDDIYDWAKSSWFQSPISKAADFNNLSSMLDAKCKLLATAGKVKNERFIEVEVENLSSVVAFFVRLSIKNDKDDLITPLFWQDNYITITPNGKKTIKCIIPELTDVSGKVTVSVSGWNVNEEKINLSL